MIKNISFYRISVIIALNLSIIVSILSYIDFELALNPISYIAFFITIILGAVSSITKRDKCTNFSKKQKLLLMIVFIYVLIIFVTGIIILKEGRGEAINQLYYLVRRGQVIREISYDEYESLCFAEARMLTNFPLYFHVHFLLNDLCHERNKRR